MEKNNTITISKAMVWMAISVSVTTLLSTTAFSADDAGKKGAKSAATKEAEPAKVTPALDPKDPRSILYLDSSGKIAGTGDKTKSGLPSEAARLGSGWHPETMASNILPKDRYGLVDWAKSARENLIEPRHSLEEEGDDPMPPLDMNVLIESKGDFTNDVIYPHDIHTWWLKCEVCHEKIFIPQKGANNMTMVGIVEGKWCGRCHGKVAFPLTDCLRCHVSPKKPAGS